MNTIHRPFITNFSAFRTHFLFPSSENMKWKFSIFQCFFISVKKNYCAILKSLIPSWDVYTTKTTKKKHTIFANQHFIAFVLLFSLIFFSLIQWDLRSVFRLSCFSTSFSTADCKMKSGWESAVYNGGESRWSNFFGFHISFFSKDKFTFHFCQIYVLYDTIKYSKYSWDSHFKWKFNEPKQHKLKL